MLDSALRDCGGQVVAYLLLVRANVWRSEVRRNQRVDGLCAGECFRERTGVGCVSNEWFRAFICKSFQALRVTAYDAHFLSLG